MGSIPTRATNLIKMEIVQRVNADYIAALKDKDNLLKEALKQVKNVFAPLIKEGVEEEGPYVQALIKLHRQRLEGMAIYEDAGRPDLAIQEQYEAGVIHNYIPHMLTDNEVLTLVFQVANSEGLEFTIKNMGAITKLTVAASNGKTTGKVVSGMVKGLIEGGALLGQGPWAV